MTILGNQIPGINLPVDPINQSVIFYSRFPRIIAGVVIGAGLAAAGVLYQGVFKNPMADPYVL